MSKQIAPSHRGFKVAYITCAQSETIERIQARLQAATPFRVTRGSVLTLALDMLDAAQPKKRPRKALG